MGTIKGIKCNQGGGSGRGDVVTPVSNEEGEGSYLTFKRLFPRVLKRMDFQGHAAFEGLPARLASERHVLGVS